MSDRMHPAREAVWGMTFMGLRKSLEYADILAMQDRTLEAAIVRASAYYSYRFVPGFFGKARKQVSYAIANHPHHSLTHGQCDVIGTILLRAGDRKGAGYFLEKGLGRNPPPHSQALLHTGLAEVHFEAYVELAELVELPAVRCRTHIREALRLESEVMAEQDRVQAQRQWCRVLRRVAILYARNSRIGDKSEAITLLDQAEKIADSTNTGSRSQLWKIRWTRLRYGIF